MAVGLHSVGPLTFACARMGALLRVLSIPRDITKRGACVHWRGDGGEVTAATNKERLHSCLDEGLVGVDQ
eukprot:10839984-Alexandrium_andersonii.AAC.1